MAICLPSVAVDGALELRLGHPRTSLHMLVLRLLIQLRLRAAAGPAVRAQAAAPARRDVPGRDRARGLGLAGTGSLLVHGSGGDLPRGVPVATSPLEALLDVLVLPFALGAPRLLRHDVLLPTLCSSFAAWVPVRVGLHAVRVAGAARPRLAGGQGGAMATKQARVSWKGDLENGTGTIEQVGSGAFGPLAVSWPARTGDESGMTSPEELIAAAHASCFSMAFSARLGKAGTPPDRLEVSATVT